MRELLGRSPRHRVQIACNKERFGIGDGTWVIHPDRLNRESIVYSIGVGDDISFDLALIERFGLNVFAFDPTPLSLAWLKTQQLPPQFNIQAYGIAATDGTVTFFRFEGLQFTGSPKAGSAPLGKAAHEATELPVHRLQTVMGRLRHSKIDLLKIDIEGAEYGVLEDLAATQIDVDQIVVEYHHRFPGFDISHTQTSVVLLNKLGYRIFDISDSGREYSFLRA